MLEGREALEEMVKLLSAHAAKLIVSASEQEFPPDQVCLERIPGSCRLLMRSPALPVSKSLACSSSKIIERPLHCEMR